ncbi:MAG: class I SAM-dependent methyltransferase [Methyloceanibacter sp.]|uniref:class I SAM-dependent methyltransferase n=1 Tax=Methyloceanibacter sp. TaxID=1965321 RepID=UPI003EE193F7
MAFAYRVADRVAATCIRLGHRFLGALSGDNERFPSTFAAVKSAGYAVYKRHYYHPFITADDLRFPLSAKRSLPGIDLKPEGQLGFAELCDFSSEILDLSEQVDAHGKRLFWEGEFGHGDGDALYSVVRALKPKRIIEVGCGQSTRIIQAAVARNGTGCRHICIEPYEQPWLESYGVEVVRQRVESCDPSIVDELEANDILFIDSSHVLRPQGDVLFELMELVPRLKKGVLVHVHDIFTPHDYPENWVLERGLLWNEQYVVECFLSFNRSYEILLAMNYLAHDYRDRVSSIFPGLAREPKAEPGSFWFRRL